MAEIPFLFIAGATPLDFLNTQIMLAGEPADLLEDAGDLLAWLGESGLASRGQTRDLRAASPATRASWLRRALALRGALRATFERLADGDPLRDADLRVLNDVLSGTPGHLALERNDGRTALEFQPNALDPVFLIARVTAAFLASADLSLVRRCEGEGCILFFHDTTKSHTRRWCSMATCGNRTKVKAHYVRKRTGG